MPEFSPKRAAFVREYLIDLNATQAAIRAGYSPKTAKAQGSRLLTYADVKFAIEKGRTRKLGRSEITADRVLQELARIAFVKTTELMTWDEERACFVPSTELTEDQAAAVQSVKAETTHHMDRNGDTETTIKLELKAHDKLGALREIGRHLGIKDNLDLTTAGQPLPSQVHVTLIRPDGEA